MGLIFKPGLLDGDAQAALLAEVTAIIAAAPLYVPRMPRTGAAMSVRMTNAGPLGWVTDQARGYRYQPTHPDTDRPWPDIPAALLMLWDSVCAYPKPPQACLVNVYGPEAKMGLHVDVDEEDQSAPVLSISLGDTAMFRIGGLARKDPTVSFRLASGDVLALTGPARRAFHGVDRILPGTSRLIPGGGRINLTLRRVTL